MVNIILTFTFALAVISELLLFIQPNRIINILSRLALVGALLIMLLNIDKGEFEFQFNLEFILVTTFSLLIPLIVDFKVRKIEQWFKWKIPDNLRKSIFLILIGVAWYLSVFLLGPFGLAAVAIPVTMVSFLREEDKMITISVMIISIGVYGVNLYEITPDLTLGKNLLGLCAGMFLVIFNSEVYSQNRTLKSGLLSLIPGVLIILLLLLLGTQKTDLGGIDSFVLSVIGIGIGVFYMGNKVFLSGVFTVLSISFLEVSLLPADESLSEKNSIVQAKETEEKKSELVFEDIKGVDIESLNGKYSIIEDSSEIRFELGPKGGRTKGVIKRPFGSLNFGTSYSAQVDLNVIDLSTFNSIRDESLMSEDYFNQQVFPGMKFIATKGSFQNGILLLSGEFELLGKKNAQTVELKYLGENATNDRHIFIGKGVIDRTKYGMKPDPKEGNVVDFNFSIQLKEIPSVKSSQQ